jgi:signal transduction histidine kinase
MIARARVPESSDPAALPQDIADRERRRLGQDLHDGLGQDLTAIALACELIERRVGPSAEVRRLRQRVRRAIQRTREVARGLYASLTAASLLRQVREAARRAEERGGLRCRVDWPRGAGPRGDAAARQLYAIVGEALTNALRHGRPRRIWIQARRTGEVLRVTVRDDGRGLGASPKDGLGLLVMRSRARALGGELRVDGDPRGGVIVDCVLPAGTKGDA